MADADPVKKIAVLIDADNAQHRNLQTVLNEITKYGQILVKRAYGDWSAPNLRTWKNVLNRLAIVPVQQFALTKGKNSTDMAMVIDAMDLLYSATYTAFALVTSDSDFARLAARLRESQVTVIGVGEKKTPESFRNACEVFLLTELLDSSTGGDSNEEDDADEVAPEFTEEELLSLLKKAADQYGDHDGWTDASAASSLINRQRPDFDPRLFGCTKFGEVLARFPKHIKVRRSDVPGKSPLVYRFG
jgi:uncharacterized protein (TIGR00288 family)